VRRWGRERMSCDGDFLGSAYRNTAIGLKVTNEKPEKNRKQTTVKNH